MRAVGPADQQAIAGALGDSPFTLIPLHQLREGIATGWLSETPDVPDALVIQAVNDPTEPTAFGRDPIEIWRILQTLTGWDCINVDMAVAAPLCALMERTRPEMRVYGDIYYTLMGTLHMPTLPDLETRLLTIDEAARFSEQPIFANTGWRSASRMLSEGAVAVSTDAGQIVSIARVTAVSERYADVGVETLPEYRRRGLSTYAAYLVMQHVVAQGRTPVWSTGEDNYASQRVAEKLGLTREAVERCYLIPRR